MGHPRSQVRPCRAGGGHDIPRQPTRSVHPAARAIAGRTRPRGPRSQPRRRPWRGLLPAGALAPGPVAGPRRQGDRALCREAVWAGPARPGGCPAHCIWTIGSCQAARRRRVLQFQQQGASKGCRRRIGRGEARKRERERERSASDRRGRGTRRGCAEKEAEGGGGQHATQVPSQSPLPSARQDPSPDHDAHKRPPRWAEARPGRPHCLATSAAAEGSGEAREPCRGSAVTLPAHVGPHCAPMTRTTRTTRTTRIHDPGATPSRAGARWVRRRRSLSPDGHPAVPGRPTGPPAGFRGYY
jgi:hypothetical protein